MLSLKAAIFSLALGVVGTASAADNIQALRVGMPHDSIYSIEQHNGVLWAVGGHGLVMSSTNDGSNWNKADSPGEFAAMDLAVTSSGPVLVGQSGKAYEGSLDGNSWNILETGTTQRLLSVVSASDGSQLAVGAFGTIIKRDPGSAKFDQIAVDWEALVDDGFEPHLYDVAETADGTILVSAEFGMILRSENGGKDWSVHNKNDSSVFALHQTLGGTLIGVGQAGYIISSDDDGVSWQERSSGTNANLLGISSSGEKIVVVGVRAVLDSNDNGQSWDSLKNRDTERRWYQGISGVSPDQTGRRFIAAGQFGQIIKF